MAQIVVEASYLELDVFGEQYDELRADLEAAGHEVDVRERLERRDLGQVLTDVALHIAGNVDAYVEGALIAAAVKRLRGKAKVGPRRGQARHARIYGPDGSLLREVELPDDEST